MFDADREFSLQTTTAVDPLRQRWLPYRNFGKRAFDVAFVVILSPLLFPVIALLALAVRLDGGAAFFGHKRVGKDGTTFTCWKLRSMVPDAEERLRIYLKAHKEEQEFWQANFKLTDDPRVTKVGRFLRKTSLDELPQFWNVLIGDMSVVGPRPVTQEETALYGNAKAILQTARPGITGLWQVSGRNNLDYDQRVALDVKYLNLFDFRADLSIILRTVYVMLRRTGV